MTMGSGWSESGNLDLEFDLIISRIVSDTFHLPNPVDPKHFFITAELMLEWG